MLFKVLNEKDTSRQETPRVHFPGAFYHAISHGNQSRLILRDDDDRERYLTIL